MTKKWIIAISVIAGIIVVVGLALLIYFLTKTDKGQVVVDETRLRMDHHKKNQLHPGEQTTLVYTGSWENREKNFWYNAGDKNMHLTRTKMNTVDVNVPESAFTSDLTFLVSEVGDDSSTVKTDKFNVQPSWTFASKAGKISADTITSFVILTPYLIFKNAKAVLETSTDKNRWTQQSITLHDRIKSISWKPENEESVYVRVRSTSLVKAGYPSELSYTSSEKYQVVAEFHKHVNDEPIIVSQNISNITISNTSGHASDTYNYNELLLISWITTLPRVNILWSASDTESYNPAAAQTLLKSSSSTNTTVNIPGLDESSGANFIFFIVENGSHRSVSAPLAIQSPTWDYATTLVTTSFSSSVFWVPVNVYAYDQRITDSDNWKFRIYGNNGGDTVYDKDNFGPIGSVSVNASQSFGFRYNVQFTLVDGQMDYFLPTSAGGQNLDSAQLHVDLTFEPYDETIRRNPYEYTLDTANQDEVDAQRWGDVVVKSHYRGSNSPLEHVYYGGDNVVISYTNAANITLGVLWYIQYEEIDGSLQTILIRNAPTSTSGGTSVCNFVVPTTFMSKNCQVLLRVEGDYTGKYIYTSPIVFEVTQRLSMDQPFTANVSTNVSTNVNAQNARPVGAEQHIEIYGSGQMTFLDTYRMARPLKDVLKLQYVVLNHNIRPTDSQFSDFIGSYDVTRRSDASLSVSFNVPSSFFNSFAYMRVVFTGGPFDIVGQYNISAFTSTSILDSTDVPRFSITNRGLGGKTYSHDKVPFGSEIELNPPTSTRAWRGSYRAFINGGVYSDTLIAGGDVTGDSTGAITINTADFALKPTIFDDTLYTITVLEDGEVLYKSHDFKFGIAFKLECNPSLVIKDYNMSFRIDEGHGIRTDISDYEIIIGTKSYRVGENVASPLKQLSADTTQEKLAFKVLFDESVVGITNPFVMQGGKDSTNCYDANGTVELDALEVSIKNDGATTVASDYYPEKNWKLPDVTMGQKQISPSMAFDIQMPGDRHKLLTNKDGSLCYNSTYKILNTPQAVLIETDAALIVDTTVSVFESLPHADQLAKVSDDIKYPEFCRVGANRRQFIGNLTLPNCSSNGNFNAQSGTATCNTECTGMKFWWTTIGPDGIGPHHADIQNIVITSIVTDINKSGTYYSNTSRSFLPMYHISTKTKKTFQPIYENACIMGSVMVLNDSVLGNILLPGNVCEGAGYRE